MVGILRCFSCFNMISSTKDESSISGILSISIFVGNSRLTLVAALKDMYNAEGVSSRFNTLFMIFNPPNFSLNIFADKNSPVRLLVRDCQCLLPSRKRKSVLPVFEFFFNHKLIHVCKAWITCHIQVSVQCGNFISFYFLP